MGQGVVEGTLDWVEDSGEDLLQQSSEAMIHCDRSHAVTFVLVRSVCSYLDMHEWS